MLIDVDSTLLVARCNSVDAVQRFTDAENCIGIKHIVLERIEMNEMVISSLTRLIKSKNRNWLSLKMVDCVCGANTAATTTTSATVDGCELDYFMDSLSNVKKLFLQTTSTNQDNSRCFFPMGANLRTPSLRLCISNLDESLAEKLAAFLRASTGRLEFCLSGSRRCGLQQVNILSSAFRENRSIEMLDLGDCNLNDDKMSRLVEALISHPKLKKLDLSNNSVADQTLQALNNLLQQENSQLQALDLGLQALHLRLHERSFKVSLLAPALTLHSTGLKHLCLSNCGLQDDEVFPVVYALTQNRQLEHFDISCNGQLSANFLIYLGERLPKMKLKVLDIRKLKPPNGSPAAMIALEKGVRQNTSLQLLRIAFWRQLRSTRWIQIYINLNRGGRRALEENIPLSLWPLVLERAQNRLYFCPLLEQPSAKEDAVYHLLRNEPAMWP